MQFYKLIGFFYLFNEFSAQNSTEYNVELQQADLATRDCNGVSIFELTINQLHKYYREQKLKPSQLVQCYINRIEKFNPKLHAVIEVSPTVLEEAKKLDTMVLNMPKNQQLFGVPILIKDNIASLDGTKTTAGSYALVDQVPKKEATVVSKLRSRGGLILGKSNLSEFAGFRSKEDDVAGWTGRGLQTRNPYVLSATASGSSTGSAVAIAANLALVSLGTETDGSIIAPSTLSANVGFKPTVGKVSTHGVIPLAATQDSVGPITRTLIDNLIVLSAIVEDQKLSKKILKLAKDKKGDDNQCAPSKFRIGILRDPYFNNELIQEQIPVLNDYIGELKKGGITIVDDLSLDMSKIDGDAELLILATEFKHYLNEYLKNDVVNKNSTTPLTLSDIIQYNKDHPDLELTPYNQSMLIFANESKPIDDPTYISTRKRYQRDARQVIDNLLKSNKVDALLLPSSIQVPSTTPSAIAGYPIITLPVAIDSEEIPFGVALFGKGGNDALLLEIAKKMDKITKKQRTVPKFKNCCTSIDLKNTH